MNSTSDIMLIGLGNLLYSLGFLMAMLYMLAKKPYPTWVLYGLIATGYGIHTWGLYIRGMAVGGCPIGNAFEIVQFIVWSLIFCYLVLGPAFRLSLFGFFAAGLSVILSGLSFAIPSWDSPYPIGIFGNNPWIEFHAALAVFSYGLFGLLAISSALYILQNYALKHRRFAGFFSLLPSLVESESMTLRMLVSGTTVLTLSLMVGAVYGATNPGDMNLLKLVFTLCVWIGYVVVLIGRLNKILFARRLAWMCISLFIIAIISIGSVSSNDSTSNEENTVLTDG